MSISNGDFLDENGRAVNLMALLRDGSVVESTADHHMAPHSGWFTDEDGEPVNLITVIQNGGGGGGGSVTVDSELSSTSRNPVQNRVIFSALAEKAGTSVATQSANGLMSSTDKATLDNVAEDYAAALVALGVTEP